MGTTSTLTATNSFGLTPQAQGDTFTYTEDSTGVFVLDVMANDLGGAAKTLWSLDDGASSSTDLLTRDTGRCEAMSTDQSANGAKIWITSDGKVGYDSATLSDSFKTALNGLGAGETMTDTFTYAIRLANGTLSWTTATVVYSGVNDAPVLTIDGAGGVTEDAANPTLTDTGTLSWTDPDIHDTHDFSADYNGDAVWSDGTNTYTLSADQITAITQGFTADGDSWDYAVANADVQFLGAGETITLSFDVTVADNHGGSDTETVTLTITGTNDDPTVTVESGDSDSASLNETDSGLTASGSLTIGDADANDTVTVSATAVSLDLSSTGSTSVSNADLLDMLTANNDGTWSFDSGSEAFNNLAAGETLVLTYTVTADDGASTGSHDVTITITGTNDAPAITSNGGGDTASVSIDENTTAVTNVTSSDVDHNDAPTYTISGGDDAALFEIDASTGVLTFKDAPDYEAPGDLNHDNVYDVQVTVTDGSSATDVQSISVTVGNVNEAPIITSNGGDDTASVSVAENSTAVTTVTATDVDTPASSLTYSISGGDDAALFHIDAATGALTFVSAPNYEAPGDLNHDNVYDVTVQVSDGSLVDTQAIAVTVTDVTESSSPITPPVYTGTGDPNDFDNLGDSASENLSSAGTNDGDTLYGGAGNDTINGGGGDDTIYGGSGTDALNGNSDSDHLYGGSGTDTIIGSNGNDVLVGGYGADTLTGSNGADTFVYLDVKDTGDTIVDFSHAEGDKIDLSAIDANTGALNNQAFAFGGDQNAVAANSVTFHYDSVANVTHVWADVNGDTTADLQIDLSGNVALTSGDFIL